jgi:hypothetical protein
MIYTKEPWFVMPSTATEIASGPQGALAYVSTAGSRGRNLDEAKANAERIVRCINFCAGARSEVLRPGLLVLSFRDLADGTVVDVLALQDENTKLKEENILLRERAELAEGKLREIEV